MAVRLMVCILPCVWAPDTTHRPSVFDIGNSRRQLASVERCSSSLLASVKFGNATQLRLKLQAESPNCVDDMKKTPLHVASEWNQRNATLLLLASGAEMRRDIRGRVPLHDAALAGHISIASLLIEAGAYIELEDQSRRRPLHLAAFRGHAQMTELLLDRSALISAADSDQRTPLHLAVRIDAFLNTTRTLVGRGASIGQPDDIGFSALHVACAENQPVTVDYLMDLGADIYKLDISGWNPLLHAAVRGHNKLVTSLVRRTLKPKEIPPPDPDNFEEQDGSGKVLGVEGIAIGVTLIMLCGCCVIAVAMWRLMERPCPRGRIRSAAAAEP